MLAASLGALAKRIPLVLVLEDVHWSDYSTLDLLSVLARRREPARLLVLCTLRPVDAGRRRSSMSRSPATGARLSPNPRTCTSHSTVSTSAATA